MGALVWVSAVVVILCLAGCVVLVAGLLAGRRDASERRDVSTDWQAQQEAEILSRTKGPFV